MYLDENLGTISLKLLGGKLAPTFGMFCTEKGALKTLVKWHPDQKKDLRIVKTLQDLNP